MLDNRKPLPNGYQIQLAGMEYTIENEIGRGAGCIVYYGHYYDRVGEKHIVRIKECCPYNLGIQRQEDGALLIPQTYIKRYEEEKIKFQSAYRRNIEIRNTLGLMNSTVDASGLFEKNQTLYIVTGAMEGCDYRRCMDPDMQSVFIRMSALAKIIKKYHDIGILHLDIKPENMLVIPETKEHIFLFDFDSLVKMDEIEKENIRFSCSDGYAAPELVRGDRTKIGVTADIYSVGAIVFEKMFGRVPNALDGSISKKYNFNKLVFPDPKYRMKPELLKEISLFLHKTIASSTAYRFQSMDQVIQTLKKLIQLSDMESAALYSNFEYSTACFVGRDAELQNIAGLLKGSHILFLSGIGGIGKTELAKRYAFEHREQYRNVLFLPFQQSIMETICGQELFLGTFEQAEEEESDEYFNRKIGMLKQLAAEDDLIILDNFDVSSDENLDILLECPCQFLITTRETGFRDYNFNQMDITYMDEMDDLLAIFRNYNPREYTEEELQSIREMIEWIDRHTMTVDLIAKYLRDTKEDPAILLKRIKEKEGITNTDNTEVRLRKDRRMRQESVNGHLNALFDLSGFAESEREILRSLSLLGYVRINRKRFLEFCNLPGGNEKLDFLIQRGWIEYNPLTDKISFHQIILDLVYHYLKPVSENCPHIVWGMQDYIERELPNSVEKEIRNRVCSAFMNRIQGKDLNYAKLCLLYNEHIRNHMQKLEEAKQICLQLPCRECSHLLQRIYRKEIQILSYGDHMMDEVFQDESLDMDMLFDRDSRKMCGLAHEAYEEAKRYSSDPAYLGRFCVELAAELDQAAVHNIMVISVSAEENNEPMNRLLDFAAALMKEGEGYIGKSSMNAKEKKKLYCAMRDFFGKLDFGALYRSERYADLDLAAKYQNMVRSLADPNVISVDDDMDYDNLLDQAKKKGEYEKAIAICRKAGEEDEFYQYLKQQIPDIYLEMGETEKAIQELREAAEANFSFQTYFKLIRLLIRENRPEEAKAYSHQLAEQGIESWERDPSPDSAYAVITGSYFSCCLEHDEAEKEGYWKRCREYFTRIENEKEYPGEIKNFLADVLSKETNKAEKARLAFQFAERTYNWWNTAEENMYFYYFVIDMGGDEPGIGEYYILALLRCAAFLLESNSDNFESAYEKCRKAKEQYEKSGIKNEYLRNLIQKTLSDCYFKSDHYDYMAVKEEQKRCDYYLLTEFECKGREEEEQITLWKDAAEKYHDLENTEMEMKCLERCEEILQKAMNEKQSAAGSDRPLFFNYQSVASARMKAFSVKKMQRELKEYAMSFFQETVRQYRQMGTDRRNCIGNLGRDLVQMGKDLGEGGLERDGLVVCILSLITILEQKLDEDLLSQAEKLTEKEPQCLLERFRRALHGTMNAEIIDQVIRLYEEMLPLLRSNGDFAAYAQELKWYSETYQYRELEFKK